LGKAPFPNSPLHSAPLSVASPPDRASRSPLRPDRLARATDSCLTSAVIAPTGRVRAPAVRAEPSPPRRARPSPSRRSAVSAPVSRHLPVVSMRRCRAVARRQAAPPRVARRAPCAARPRSSWASAAHAGRARCDRPRPWAAPALRTRAVPRVATGRAPHCASGPRAILAQWHPVKFYYFLIYSIRYKFKNLCRIHLNSENYVCVCAFSLRQKSPNMILGDKPLISEVVLSQLPSGFMMSDVVVCLRVVFSFTPHSLTITMASAWVET
jgi:hypothetical protein